MLKKITVFALLLPASLPAVFGQTSLGGQVLDQTTSEPMPFVSVALYLRADSVAVGGSLTDSTGSFVISNIRPGQYTLKTFFVGYKTATFGPINLVRSRPTALTPIRLLPDTKLLDEVQVIGQRANVVLKADRQTFRAGQFQAAVGGTANDVLKNLPGISLNVEGEVTLRGANGFLVLLNGKPVQANLGTLLNQLPANGIESIEVITTPSARYDPDGKAGIIAIVTKKGAEKGLSAQFNALGGFPSLNAFGNARNPVRFGSDLALNYRSTRWELAMSTSYLRNDVAGRREGDVSTTIGNRFTRFPSLGERSYDRYTFTNRVSATYTPNARDTWTTALYYGQRTEYRLADIFYDNTTTDFRSGQVIGRSSYFNSNLVKKRGAFYTGSLDYTHTLANKASLGAGMFYEYDFFDGFTDNLNLNRSDYRDTLQHTFTTTARPLRNVRANVDAAFPLGGGRLELGYQYRSQQDEGDFVFLENRGNGTPLLVVPEFTGGIRVDNLIHGLYTQFSKKKSGLEYTAGLRYEYVVRRVRTTPRNAQFPLTLDNLFPSFNLIYSLPAGWQVKAGYSRRVQRSSNFALNPLPEREHSETLEQGDPTLLPEFVGLSEMGLSRTGLRSTWLLTLYHQQVTNIVNRVNSVYADSILNRIYTNAGRAQRLGLELTADLSLTKAWKLNAGGTVYRYAIDGALFQSAVVFRNTAWAFSFNANSTLQLDETITVQASLNYLSQRITAQGEDSRFLTPNLSIRKSFLKNRLALLAQWQNIGLGFLPSNKQRITTRGRDFFTTTNYIQEKDVILLNLSYSFRPSTRRSKFPASEVGDKEF